MKKLLFVGIIMIMNLSTKAQIDNLEPEEGFLSCHPTFEEYYITLKNNLLENLPYYTDARAIVIPSFGKPQYLVSIDSKDGLSYLTYRILKEQIGIKNKKNDKIEYREYKMKLDTTLANRLHDLFFLATSKVRYPEGPYFGTDGITYTFMSSKQFYGTRSGKIWSPEGGRLLGLVQITDWLAKCAKEKEITDKDKMVVTINELIEKFRNN